MYNSYLHSYNGGSEILLETSSPFVWVLGTILRQTETLQYLYPYLGNAILLQAGKWS